MEPGFGEDVRLQPPATPPTPPRKKHASYHGDHLTLPDAAQTSGAAGGERRRGGRVIPRTRHSSEPHGEGGTGGRVGRVKS